MATKVVTVGEIMDHPLDMLLVKDGQLFQRIGANVEHVIPYMNLGEIKVLETGEANPIAGQPGFWAYPFELNAAVDSVWRELFLRNFTFDRRVAPHFENKRMILECEPVNLQVRYAAIKVAMGKTNGDYIVESEKLVPRVQQEMAKRELEAMRKAEAEEKIRRAFDELEL